MESELRKQREADEQSYGRLKSNISSCKLALKSLKLDLSVEKALIPKLQDSEHGNAKDLAAGKVKKAKTSLVSVPSNIGIYVKQA